jgi:hypothetical protein
MARITAIELGADTCAFARTIVRRGEVHLSAAEILDPAAFPGTEAFTVGVRQTRRSLRLPRRCRVVLWGLPDGANRKDAAVKLLLAPLTNAGFNVDRVVSPCNALAALARLKTSRFDGSTCWLAINRGGVAIVVVRPGKLLYAHSFAWDSTIGATGSQARLLQRYTLVSFLSPEVKRAMAEARKSGMPVDAVVICGNLPELRALTMPLIEELDVEVETLDSFEGLIVKPPVAEKLAESAPAIRMACAAAIARGTRPWDPSKKSPGPLAIARFARAAVFAAVIAGVAYAWYARFAPVKSPAPVVSAPPAKAPAQQGRAQIQTPIVPIAKAPPLVAPLPTPSVTTSSPPPPPVVQTAKSPLVTVPPPKATATVVTASTPAPKITPPVMTPPTSPAAAPTSTPPPVVQPARTPPVTVPPPKATLPVVTATNTVPRTPLQALVTLPRPNLPAPAVARATGPAASIPETRRPALNTPAIPADKPGAGATSEAPPPGAVNAPRGPMPALLKDAVPRVTAILVSRDRRFATVDGGQVIGIGDLLGRRTVVGMDERSVLLQEPSGVQIRIGLGGRLLGVERVAR